MFIRFVCGKPLVLEVAEQQEVRIACGGMECRRFVELLMSSYLAAMHEAAAADASTQSNTELRWLPTPHRGPSSLEVLSAFTDALCRWIEIPENAQHTRSPKVECQKHLSSTTCHAQQ